MAEEKKVEKKKPAGKQPAINSNVVFFAILVVGIIIFTVILLLKPSTTVYRANLAQNAECIVQVSKKDIDIGVKIDGEVITQQHGTYTKRVLEEGEKPESETAVEYVITFENEADNASMVIIVFDNNSDNASMVIDGNKLTLYLADDTIIECVADEPNESTTTQGENK